MDLQNGTLASAASLAFTWTDYILFVLMFGFSALIGIYYGCCGNKQSSTEDYLHGGKKMSVFPVAMSLMASNLSGISLLGIPAEVYMNGTLYSVCIISVIFLVLTINYCYLPVFYKLQVTSAYEYLEMRFNTRVRLLTSLLFVLTALLYIPIVIYVPALAFSQVSGISLYIITPVISCVCIFYTTIGGLKAVVWTDTLQFSVTMLTLGFVLIMGTISVGGFSTVWNAAIVGERLEFFKMDINPTLRASFWSVLIGQGVNWMSQFGCNPATVQRFIALPSLKAAKRSIVIFGFGTILAKAIISFCGLIMYAKYIDCDPIKAHKITKPDQILPYYVLDVAAAIPGLTGLFVAGVFSTAFSTLSTYLNTLSGIIYMDFVLPNLKEKPSGEKSSNILKLLVVVLGFICVGMVFMVEKLGAVLELNIALSGITLGPILGIFTLGMISPMANTTGVTWGSLGSLAIVSWLIIKNRMYTLSGVIKNPIKPFHTHGCEGFNNASEIATASLLRSSETEDPLWIFRISFYYYALVGAVICLLIALPISWFTQTPNEKDIDPDLLFPFVQRFVKRTAKTSNYETVELNPPIVMEKK